MSETDGGLFPSSGSILYPSPQHPEGGRFEFDDGGTYIGGWEDEKAHGHGVCTGPKGQGEYAGSWHYGFEVSGSYTWPSGSSYEGHWQNGKRHGLGVESRGRWLYRGEWTQGFKGRYGVRQSAVSNAKYEGTWANGLQDGYGSETYGDGGTYQGQWLRGLRHGYGVRSSAPFGTASSKILEPESEMTTTTKSLLHLLDGNESKESENNEILSPEIRDGRGGFVLRAKSDDKDPSRQRRRRRSLVERSGMKTFVQGLKLKKQRSTGDLDKKGISIRSTGSTTSWMSTESGVTAPSLVSEGSTQSFVIEDDNLEYNVTETYLGEWKNDKRSGFGISERSDGLKYEGEWYNNKKYGYGVTYYKNGEKEEGKYKNNILISSSQKRHIFLMRSAKFRERIDSATNAASRASKIALQKADIAISRTATGRGKAEMADIAAAHAREDAKTATLISKEYSNETSKDNVDFSIKDQRSSLLDSSFKSLPNSHSKHSSTFHLPNISLTSSPQKICNESLKNEVLRSQNSPTASPSRFSTLRSSKSCDKERNDSFQLYNPRPNSDSSFPSNSTSTQFTKILDDHFEHYRRPRSRPPSRQPSVEHMALPATLPEAKRSSRAPSVISNGGDGIRNRISNQEIVSLGPLPKRTESLYLKDTILTHHSSNITRDSSTSSLIRKKSLPEFVDLNIGIMESCGSKEMTREEISVLSSHRRDNLRQQLEEAEKIRKYPLLYFTSPKFKEWVSGQQLVLLVFFVNLSLAIMFFKLLT